MIKIFVNVEESKVKIVGNYKVVLKMVEMNDGKEIIQVEIVVFEVGVVVGIDDNEVDVVEDFELVYVVNVTN